MLAVAVDLLTGRYLATAYNDRGLAEWPPHPARLFSALVAALPREGEEPDPAAEEALRWLETLSPPAITASQASARAVWPTFVPVNDMAVVNLDDRELHTLDEAEAAVLAATTAKEATKATKARDKALLRYAGLVDKAIRLTGKPAGSDLKSVTQRFQAHGLRQPRTFPSVTPQHPRVVFQWPDAHPSPSRRDALDRLAERVTRLGHSSSLVSLRLVDSPPPPSLLPDPDGALVLRVPGPGQLSRLEAAFAVHQESEPRVLPCAFKRYGPPGQVRADPPPHSIFSEDWVVFRRIAGPMLPLSAVAELSARMRAALMSRCPEPVPWALSGHEPDGKPTRDPHAAFFCLPFVGHEHADGLIRGLALSLPRDLPAPQRVRLLAAVAAWEDAVREDDEEHPALELQLGPTGTLVLERVIDRAPLRALRPDTWCAPSRRWATVTPIALDRNPGELRSRDRQRLDRALAAAAETIAVACERIGLPRPMRVEVQPGSPFVAGLPARSFPAFPPQAGRTRRVQVHARLEFDQPVAGPISLGAGRFLGLGLCRPLLSED